MPSKDTIPFHITIKSRDEIGRIRCVISEELGICIEDIPIKKAEIAFRLKAQNGKIKVKTLEEIMLGKIKWTKKHKLINYQGLS